MLEVHISRHSIFRLKITVGCLWSTYPSIHFSLDEDTLRGDVLCGLLCVVFGVLRGGGVVWCVGVLFLSFSLVLSFSLSLNSLLSLSRSLSFFLLWTRAKTKAQIWAKRAA